MKENFVICIESLHVADLGDKDNVSKAQIKNIILHYSTYLHLCKFKIFFFFLHLSVCAVIRFYSM